MLVTQERLESSEVAQVGVGVAPVRRTAVGIEVLVQGYADECKTAVE